jgi:hypothetical protein
VLLALGIAKPTVGGAALVARRNGTTIKCELIVNGERPLSAAWQRGDAP